MKETEIKKGGVPPFPPTGTEPKTAKLPDTPPTPATTPKKGVPDHSKVGPIAPLPPPSPVTGIDERVRPLSDEEAEGYDFVTTRCCSCNLVHKFPKSSLGETGACECGSDIKITDNAAKSCDTKMKFAPGTETKKTMVLPKWLPKVAGWILLVVFLIYASVVWIFPGLHALWNKIPSVSTEEVAKSTEPTGTVQALDEAIRKELAEAKVALTVAVKNGEEMKTKLAKAESDLANADLAQKTAKITLSNVLQEKEGELRIVKARLVEANEANDAILDSLDVPEGGGMSLQKLEIDGVEGFLFRIVQTATTSPSAQRQVAPPPPEQPQ